MSREFFILGGLTLSLTLFVGSTFNSSSALLVAFAVAAVVAWRRSSRFSVAPESFKHSHGTSVAPPHIRWTIALIAAGVALVWRLSLYGSATDNPILMGADSLSHAMLVAMLFVWAKRPRRGHHLMLGAAMMMILACVLAGGTSPSQLGQITIGLFASTGFLLAAPIVLNPQAEAVSRGRRTLPGGWKSRLTDTRTLLTWLVATGILTGTSLVARATSDVMPDVQKILRDRLSGTLEDLSRQLSMTGTRYVNGSRIGEIRDHMLGSPEEIAIRCDAESAPGYLRGTVFTRLDDRDWRTHFGSGGRGLGRSVSAWGTPSFREPYASGGVVLTQDRRNELSRFDLRSTSVIASGSITNVSDPIKTVEVMNRPKKGNTIFTSLSTLWMEAAAAQVRLGVDRMVSGNIDLTKPYVLAMTKNPLPETLAAERRAEMVSVTSSLQRVTSDLAASICTGTATARNKADAVVAYFQSNFEYSLEYQNHTPPRIHPLEHFLRSRHPAHCEYFASSAALILRQAGVPTRYVTGYVATEQSVEEDDFLARNRDAHAWVEAYDDVAQVWFPVEATPGRRYRTLQFGDDADALGLIEDDLDVSNIGGPSGIIGWIQFMVARSGVSQIVGSAFRLVQLPMFVALLGLLWYRGRLRAGGNEDAAEVASARMLRSVDKRVRRRKLVRRPSETLHQFAKRIDDDKDRQPDLARNELARIELTLAAAWYRQFATARYTGVLPDAASF